MAKAQPKSGSSPPTAEEIQMHCPDPSVHGVQPAKLQDQASKAALYVSGHGERNSMGSPAPSSISALGPDGRLSSAGAAASLKYAKAHELPSYPSVGIDTASSGHKAANLATQTSKSPEWWKPELSSAAGKAALLAHKDGGNLNLWQLTSSQVAHSAAGGAMVKGAGLSPQLDYGHTEDGKKNSLLAATLSVSSRNKVETSPPAAKVSAAYPDVENAAFNALNAASVAHKPQDDTKPDMDATEASRVVHIGHNVSREIWTDHPPIMQEIEERKRSEALRASTAVFHKQMVDAGRGSVDVEDGQIAARKMANQPPKSSSAPGPSPELIAQAKNYLSLQEAAQKLAQERLAKLDPDGINAYRDHYGYSQNEKKGSLRKSRRGQTADDSSDDEDEQRAGRIRSQMRNFNDQLASVDAKKRDTDRAALMAAAEKSVRERMLNMDNQVFQKTGVASPAMMEGWVAEANAKATANSEQRMATHGKVHIGGGKYMDQADLDAIAAGRLQPTLDEIADTAEKQRQRDEEIRLDEERRKAEAEAEKQKKAEEVEFAKTKKRMAKEEAKQIKEQRKEADREAKGDKQGNRRSFFGGFASFRGSKRSSALVTAGAGGAAGGAAAEGVAAEEGGEAPVSAAQQIAAGGDEEAIKKLEDDVGKIDGPVAAAHDPALETEREFEPQPVAETEDETEATAAPEVESPAPQIPQLDVATPLDVPELPATPAVEKSAEESTGAPNTTVVAAGVVEPTASSVSFNKGSKDSKRKSSIRGIFGKLKRGSKSDASPAESKKPAKTEGIVSANLASGPPPEIVSPQYETAAKDDATGLYSEPSIEEATAVKIEQRKATETSTEHTEEETKGGVMSKLLGKKRDSVVSPVSSAGEGDATKHEEAAAPTSAPDDGDEARDKFEEQTAAQQTTGERPLSKFQEDL